VKECFDVFDFLADTRSQVFPDVVFILLIVQEPNCNDSLSFVFVFPFTEKSL